MFGGAGDIEVSELCPGSCIDQEECERLIGFTRLSDPLKWQLALLNLRNEVLRLLEQDGKIYTITCSDAQLNILTHKQASEYNARKFETCIDGMRRANKRLSAVDVAVLSKEDRDQHDKSMMNQSRMLLAIKSNRREPIVLTPSSTVKATRGSSGLSSNGGETLESSNDAGDQRAEEFDGT